MAKTQPTEQTYIRKLRKIKGPRGITIDRCKTGKYDDLIAVCYFLADENETSATHELARCAKTSDRYKKARKVMQEA